jgi:hypothetical protein
MRTSNNHGPTGGGAASKDVRSANQAIGNRIAQINKEVRTAGYRR